MRNLNIAIRSLFKKGRHNVMNNLTIPSIRMRTGFTGSMRIIA